MCCTSGSQPGLNLVRLLVVVCLSLSGADFICQPCGAELSLPIVPQPIAWASGPAKVSLRGIAEVQVPAGYSYTDAKGAQAFLEGMRSGVPKELAGILQPTSGAWWATFEVSEVGFVKDEDKEQLDPDAILKKLGEEMNRPNEKARPA